MRKTVIITGSKQGLGKYLASVLNDDYNLILCDRDYSGLSEYSFSVELPCNVSNKEEVETTVKAGLDKFGRIDVLINNAGLMLFDKFEDIKEEDLDAMYNVNVKGTLFFSQAVLPIMKKQKGGYIINIGSTRGITGAPTKGAYAMTKFGVRALAETIFAENKDYGIKTTTICPGRLEKDLVTYQDIANTVNYLLSLGPQAHIKEIIIGGKL